MAAPSSPSMARPPPGRSANEVLWSPRPRGRYGRDHAVLAFADGPVTPRYFVGEFILELRTIPKRFSGVEVLHQVSFALRPGEVHALLGENGAGKSTLVKVMTGVHQADSGQILMDGEPVHFADPGDTRRAGIAAIYQELSLFPDLDVAENIFAGRQPTAAGGRIDWAKLYRDAGALLTSLGVNLDLKKKARSLSIAQQQMVEIARALSSKARVVIMDEPTSSLT